MTLTELQEELTKNDIKWDMYIKERFYSQARNKWYNPAIRGWFRGPQIITINKDNDCEIILKWFLELKNNDGYPLEAFENWDQIKYRLSKEK